VGKSNAHLFTISEKEFAMICEELRSDAESIFKHNPRSTREESLLWMLLGILISYLNLSESETPCFQGEVNAKTYRDAISFVLARHASEKFDIESYLKMFED
jgi:hypothetical protein